MTEQCCGFLKRSSLLFLRLYYQTSCHYFFYHQRSQTEYQVDYQFDYEADYYSVLYNEKSSLSAVVVRAVVVSRVFFCHFVIIYVNMTLFFEIYPLIDIQNICVV